MLLTSYTACRDRLPQAQSYGNSVRAKPEGLGKAKNLAETAHFSYDMDLLEGHPEMGGGGGEYRTTWDNCPDG